MPGSLFNPVGTLFPLAPGLQSILGQPVDDAWIDRVLEQTWRGVAAADARDTSR